MASSESMLCNLPDELLLAVAEWLPNKSIKCLRLANRRLSRIIEIRFDRVFISPNEKNLEVFCAVANHPKYSKRVKEIIWDDATLVPHSETSSRPDRFMYHWRNIVSRWRLRNALLSPMLPPLCSHTCIHHPYSTEWTTSEECSCQRQKTVKHDFQYYGRLYQEQEAIIRSGQDALAFRYGLFAFTSLERITLDYMTYGRQMDKPKYQTPMIRSFPPGFVLPIPRVSSWEEILEAPTWDSISPRWLHGFTVVLNELAAEKKAIREFIVSTSYTSASLPAQLFVKPSNDLNNLGLLLRRQGLRRLTLSVDMDLILSRNARHFRDAIAECTSLEHFSFHTNERTYLRGVSATRIQVTDALPVEKWTRLQHLSLGNFFAIFHCFLDFLGKLPPTIQSLEFINVEFPHSQKRDVVDILDDEEQVDHESNESWANVLEHCRDNLGFQPRQPQIVIARLPGRSLLRRAWSFTQREQIAAFFAGGLNPCTGPSEPRTFLPGFGIDDFWTQESSYE